MTRPPLLAARAALACRGLDVINVILLECNLIVVVSTVRGVLFVDLCRLGKFAVLLQVSCLSPPYQLESLFT
jgi:hypothetical protein